MTSISSSSGNSLAARERLAGGWTGAGHYLQGRRGLYVLAIVLVGVGLAFSGAWWGFAAILPLLFVLPCAAMMAMCMKGHGSSGQSNDAKPDPIPNLTGGPAEYEAGPR